MADIYGLGPAGETYALELLRARGYRLLERNFRCRDGELDLVLWHQETLVFAEVRTRAADADYDPAESVTPAKQRRLLRAAQYYLLKRWGNRPPPPCRFDVVRVLADGARITGGEVFAGAFQA